MSDTIDDFRAMKDHKKALRAAFGIPCPMCRQKQPKREPTIMLPGQRCRVDGYQDDRDRLTDAQWGDPWAHMAERATGAA